MHDNTNLLNMIVKLTGVTHTSTSKKLRESLYLMAPGVGICDDHPPLLEFCRCGGCGIPERSIWFDGDMLRGGTPGRPKPLPPWNRGND